MLDNNGHENDQEMLSSSGGDYAYFGMRKGIENALNWSDHKVDVDKLDLCINVDESSSA